MFTYSLITGASAGIGRAFAWECAKRKMNLILVALPNTGLKELTDELRKVYDIRAEYLELDLRESDAPQRLFTWCEKRGLRVNMLINNAGIGHSGRLEKHTTENIAEMIDLNIRSLVMLTRLFIPELKKHKHAYILNMASLGGYKPVPYKSVYSATKSFVYNFTRAIHVELKNTSVKVSVCAPGGVATNPKVIERIQAGGYLARVSQLSPQQVASYTLPRMLKGRVVIVPGILNRIILVLNLIVPMRVQLKFLDVYFRNEGIPNKKK
ncbi:MAG: SDR family NAD(P)-dependent oxidoreductase [Bacteroidetes bacterium]|nr:SDR family NAD(P)-dependent oxidoreductase [Bacteroidota bacterium]